MKRLTRYLATVPSGLAMLLLPAGGAFADDDWSSNQAIVELAAGVEIEDINAEYDTIVLGRIDSHRLYLLQLPEEWTEEEFEQHIENDDRVEEAELNYEGEAAEGQTESFYLVVDPLAFQEQYVRAQVRLGDAHGRTRGAGVVVAVLDTGIDAEHPLLRDRIVAGGYNFVDDNEDVRDVGDGVDNDGDEPPAIDELTGHGTFVAGLVVMMAPEVSVLPIKVLDSDGTATSFRVAQGIYHAVEQGAHVINLSLVVTQEHAALEDAVEFARGAGVVIVAAAGNLDSDEDAYPAKDSETIAVAATDADDRKSPFSNFGDHVALSAPGVAVVSAVPGDRFAQWEGTSASAALVSGAAALVKSIDPEASPAVIEAVLRDSAADIYRDSPPLNRDYEDEQALGSGRLDAAAAVGSIIEIIPADLNGDGVVDFADLLMLLNDWGSPNSPADLDGSGVVDFPDLLLLLAAWT